MFKDPDDPKVLGIEKNVFILGLVSMLADISSEMVYPFISIFLADVLKTSRFAIGLIEGIAESTASISTLFSGWFSDKINKRKLLAVIGYSFGVISRPLLGLATFWPQVLGLRFFDRVGKGVRTAPRDAIIADSVPITERGKAFGFHRTLDTLGAIIGPLVASSLLLFVVGQSNYRAIFFAAGLPALLSVLLLGFFAQEKVAAKKEAKPPKLQLRAFPPQFKLFLVVVVIFGLGNSSNVFLLLRAKQLGISAALIPIFYVLFNLTYAGFSLPAGILSDKIGRRLVLIIGYLAFAFVYLGFAFTKTAVFLWPLIILYGTFPAFTEGVQRAFAADLSPPALRASGLGIYHFLNGLAIFPASFIGGWLWDIIGPEATFLYGAVLAFSAVLFFAFVFPRATKTTA